MTILGIDPGLAGALAWMTEDGEIVEVADLPILDEGPRRKSIDAAALADLLASRPASRAVIEAVHARPTDSKVSAFTFGRNLGALEAIVMASGAPLARVAPIAWRRAAGLAAGVGKDASIAAALRLVPSARPFIKRHDQADAVLIAWWGSRHA
jgi:crossover junction endodeoxyribonuclease RuvC